jgi:hypothetical protein
MKRTKDDRKVFWVRNPAQPVAGAERVPFEMLLASCQFANALIENLGGPI